MLVKTRKQQGIRHTEDRGTKQHECLESQQRQCADVDSKALVLENLVVNDSVTKWMLWRYVPEIEEVTAGQTYMRSHIILKTGHTYSTISETLEILHFEKKGQLLNTLKC
jgi:hypothetical protein